nr:hypothetical protein Iba_chr07bCG5150 [Ipomoea batatas]
MNDVCGFLWDQSVSVVFIHHYTVCHMIGIVFELRHLLKQHSDLRLQKLRFAQSAAVQFACPSRRPISLAAIEAAAGLSSRINLSLRRNLPLSSD